MVDVRIAVRSDRDAVVNTVVAAFAHDLAWSFMHQAEFDRIAPLLAGALFDLRVDAGRVWVTAGVEAVSMWEEPGGTSFSSAQESADVWQRYRDEAGEQAWSRLHAYDTAVDAVAPTTRYWYLGVLATHPAHQGTGCATAVVAPALALADRDHLPTCLETSNPANKPFYARLGFEPTADVLIDGGPPTWWLTRLPTQSPST
jgi:GNAT superfamily N-acetyltransferase